MASLPLAAVMTVKSSARRFSARRQDSRNHAVMAQLRGLYLPYTPGDGVPVWFRCGLEQHKSEQT